MGNALRLHPLLVIFGLLAGGEVYGLAGALIALPLLAAGTRDLGVLLRARRARVVGGGRAVRPGRGRGPGPSRRPADGSSRGRRARAGTYASTGVSAFPATTRFAGCGAPARCASLVRETRLDLDDFVHAALRRARGAAERAAARRWRGTPSTASSRECEELLAPGVKAVLLFGIPEEKDDEGSGAWDDDGIVQQALRALRPSIPELVLLTDVCLCEYTSHGHCGVLRDGEVDNDATLELLARTAVSHVEAGADVGRAERHDGRPRRRDPRGAARHADRRLRGEVRLRVLRPVPRGRRARRRRSATGAATRWIPANVREALRECELDVAEGADVLMVKPALPYLDVIRAVRERFDCPLAAYNVSGEYAMVKAAAAAGLPRRAAGRARVADGDQARRRRPRLHATGRRSLAAWL